MDDDDVTGPDEATPSDGGGNGGEDGQHQPSGRGLRPDGGTVPDVDPEELHVGPNADDPAVAAAREEVIQAMERSAELYGINRSWARLYGILFFADDPLSLDDVVDESGYAKSTVSTALNEMARFHLVHRRSLPGEGKKAFYEAERDFWEVLQEFLRREVDREISLMSSALEDAEATLEQADDSQADSDLEKVTELSQTYDRSRKLVDLLTSSSIDRIAGLVERLGRGE